MSSKYEKTPENYRKIILNTYEPLIIKKQIDSALLKWNLDDWKCEIGDEKLRFRCGKNEFSRKPQWESGCGMKEATFGEFLDYTKEHEKEWWYFDYKYLKDWFVDKKRIIDHINWSSLGFPEITPQDCTIWIGSKGAHTPCHQDTYGCNLVFQIYGKKRWWLFRPEENLKPTRIPFEESSIYSKINFFSPNVQDFRGVGNFAFFKDLEPGEVMVVPNKWWHYVENLEVAICVNVWVPLPQDNLQRIKEGVASLFVQKLPAQHIFQSILNPNMLHDMPSFDTIIPTISQLARQIKTEKSKRLKSDTRINIYGLTNDWSTKLDNVHGMSILNKSEIIALAMTLADRFKKEDEEEEEEERGEVHTLLEVLMDDDVLEVIAQKLIDKV